MTIEWMSSLVTPGEKLGLRYVSTASSCSLSLEPSCAQKCQLWSLLYPLTWSETDPEVEVLGDFPELPGLDECISLSRLHSKTRNLGYRKPQTYFFTILEKSGEGSPFGLLMDSHLFDMYSCELSSVGVVSGGWGIGERQRKGKREREREKVRVLWCLFIKVPTLGHYLTSIINTFLEASFLNIATQEVRASTYRFWGLNKSSL